MVSHYKHGVDLLLILSLLTNVEPNEKVIDTTPISITNSSLQLSKITPSSSRDARTEFPHLTRALDFASGVLNDVDKLVNSVARNSGEVVDSAPCTRPMDCADIFLTQKPHRDGLYKIWPRSRLFKDYVWVYCDMKHDGGGWTLIQKRGDFDSGQDYFYKNWGNYKAGFGDLTKDFWIGNDIIFALTNQRANVLKFELKDWEGNTTYAEYDEFWIDDEAHKYTVHVGGYRGTAGDSFSTAASSPFTTNDRDNDQLQDGNCAVTFKGAWWYTACHASNLNGYYWKGRHESYADGVEWDGFRGLHYSLKDTVMKLRPKDFVQLQTPAGGVPQ